MKFLLLMLIPLLTSCAATTPEIRTERVLVDTGCNWTRPILVSQADDFSGVTKETIQQILAHNRLYDRNCKVKK